MSDSHWRSILRTNFIRLDALAEFLELSEEQKHKLYANPRFVLNLPRRLAQKIRKGTLEDPIFKQFIPLQAETYRLPAFLEDPVCDQSFRRAPKLLHKYQGRALIVCTSACAMHCRYCFRQNFDYETQEKGFDAELACIAADPSISEILLSGGDPLSLNDQILKQLLGGIASISHIRRVRFHTRFPIGIPERIDASFLSLFHSLPFQVYVVIHVNHAKELDGEILEHLNRLRRLGITLLNQTVLLKGVNDASESLCELFELLVNHGIIPYYLHQLDRVQGAGHFEVPIEQGKKLMQEISQRLPGYAIPKYVQEIPGSSGKTVIDLSVL